MVDRTGESGEKIFLKNLSPGFGRPRFFASSEKSVGYKYAPGAGGSDRAASAFLFVASSLSNEVALSGKRYTVDRELIPLCIGKPA